MAVTTAVLKLNHGGATLNLMSGRYAADFVPPDADVTFSVATGSSANRLGGGAPVGWKAANRSLSFRVRVLGDSEREITRGVEDVRAFLNRGDEFAPVSIEYKPNSDTPRPSWGQDGTRFYEVVTFGSIVLDPLYATKVREKAARFIVTVVVKPYALGLPQVAAQAKGHIAHDIPGTVDGRDKGIIIAYNATNFITNPIFGHPTWSTGWLSDANMRSDPNTESEFVLWGIRSAKLRPYVTNADFYTTATLTVASYTLSWYAKLQDGGVIDSSVCVANFKGSSGTPTFVALGNGWYLAYYTGTGAATVQQYGIRMVGLGKVMYVAGVQVELSALPTALCYGDLYGCAWSGTAHDSSTTRTAAYLRVPLDRLAWNQTFGSVRVVVDSKQGAAGSDVYMWQESGTSAALYYAVGAGRWTYTNGSSNITYTAAFAANTVYTVHVTWAGATISMYLNGALVASQAGAAYGSSADPANLYIGSTSGAANQHIHGFRDLSIWDTALTSGQVASDYANISAIVADNQRVSSIPYFWTEDGDGTVDTYDDSTYTNWAVLNGVPGTINADTEYRMTCAVAGVVPGAIGLWNTREFIKPSRLLYMEQSGTAVAGCSGGEFYRSSIGTTESDAAAYSGAWTADHNLYRFIGGRQWASIARIRVASTGGRVRQALLFGGSNVVTSVDWAAFTYAAFRFYVVPPIVFPELNTESLSYSGLYHTLRVKNATAAVNTDVDFYCLFPRPFALLKLGSSATVIRGTTYAAEDTTGPEVASGTSTESLDAAPDTNNVILIATLTPVVGDAPVTTWTFTRVTVVPRFALV